MTTLNLQVAANNDDAYESDLGYEESGYSGYIYLAHWTEGVNDEIGGFQFSTGVSLNGVTINSAYLQLYSNNGDTGSGWTLKVVADDASDPGNWSAGDPPSDITETTAKVDWDPGSWATGWETSPDIASIIQELADSNFISSDVRIVVRNDGTTGNNDVDANDYSNSSANAAKLDIDYTGVTAVDVFDDNANLVSLWKLEEASGTRYDSVGSNDLADNNTVGQSADQKEGTYSADFEAGNSEYLSIADNASLSITGSISIVCWVKAETLPGNMDLVNKYNSSGNQRSYYAWIRDDSSTFYPRLNVSSNGTAYTGAQGDTGLSTATWYHLAFVYDGTDLRVYLDGVLDMTPVAYSSGIYDGTAALNLGRYPDGSEYYDGLLDEVAIFNDALSAGEVLGIFQSGIQAAAGGAIPVMMHDYRRMRV